MERLIREEARQYLRMDPAPFARLLNSQQLPAIRVSRKHILFEKADLDKWLESRKTGRNGRKRRARAN